MLKRCSLPRRHRIPAVVQVIEHLVGTGYIGWHVVCRTVLVTWCDITSHNVTQVTERMQNKHFDSKLRFYYSWRAAHQNGIYLPLNLNKQRQSAALQPTMSAALLTAAPKLWRLAVSAFLADIQTFRRIFVVCNKISDQVSIICHVLSIFRFNELIGVTIWSRIIFYKLVQISAMNCFETKFEDT